MSFLVIGYTCHCSNDQARLGTVDGDTGKVYCGTCEGVLGDVEDFYGVTTKHIQVKTPYSFPEAITVQTLTAEGDLWECNHAGAEEEALEFTVHSSYDGGAYTAPDDSRTESVLVCDKENCQAWQDLDGSWRSDNG